MDKIKHYASLLREILNEYKELDAKATNSDVELKDDSIFVFDEVDGVFAWFGFGWNNQRRTKAMRVFARLKDEKIHIEEDWTEEGIATLLMKKGVPAKDIVLEFHPPEMRQYTEFALN